jgi:hypothetical protein
MEQHRAPRNATAMVKEALTRTPNYRHAADRAARAAVRDTVNRGRNQPDFAHGQVRDNARPGEMLLAA